MGKEAQLGIPSRVARLALERTASALPIFRMKVESIENLDRPAKLLEQGTGVIFAFSHPSRKETLQAFQMLFRLPNFRNIKMLIPVALHEKMFFMTPIGMFCGVKTDYVATKRTVEKGKEKGKEINPRLGHTKLKKDLRDLLSIGGAAPIFIQGTRSSSLYASNPKTLGALIGSMRNDNLNFGITLVGVGIEGVEDYSKAKGVNLFRKYNYSIGETFMSSELPGLAGGLGKVDDYILEQFEPLVPKNYIGEKPIRD